MYLKWIYIVTDSKIKHTIHIFAEEWNYPRYINNMMITGE